MFSELAIHEKGFRMYSLQIFYSIIVGLLLLSLFGATGLAVKKYRRKFNLLYIMVVGSIIGYFIVDIYLQDSNLYSVFQYGVYEKLSNFFILFSGTFLILLISDLTGYKFRSFNLPFIIPLLFFIIVNFAEPFGFYYKDVTRIDVVSLPMGITHVTPVGSASIYIYFVAVYVISLLIFVVKAIVFAYKNHNRENGNVILVSFFPALIILLSSNIALMSSGGISLAGILLGDFSLLYLAISLGTKNFSDVLRIVGTTKSLDESENKFKALADSIALGILAYRDDVFIYANKASEQISGYTIDEFIGMKFWHFVAPEYQAIIRERGWKRQSGESLSSPIEIKIIAKDGREKWVSISGNTVEMNGKIAGLISVEDITGRKVEADLLEESREKYRALSEAAFESIFISEKGLCIEQNKTAELKFGYTNEEALGRYGTEWIIPEDRDRVMQNMLNGFEEPYEATALRKDGTTFPCMLRGKMMSYKGKSVRVTSLTDISDRIQAEVALRQSALRYETLFTKASVGIISLSFKGIITSVNESFAKMHGYTVEELLGIHVNSLDTPEAHQFIEERMESILAGGQMQFEVEHFHKDGHRIRLEVTTSGISIGDEKLILSFNTDITERKRTEEALYLSSLRYETLFTKASVGIVSMSIEGKIFVANESFAQMHGYGVEELVGLSIYDLDTPDSAPHVPERAGRINSGESMQFELGHFHKDGHILHLEVNTNCITIGSETFILSFYNDISERKLAEAALKESEEKYRTLIQYSADPIFSFNPDYTYRFVNETFAKTFGKLPADLMGKSPHILFTPEEAEKRLSLVRQVLETGVKGEIVVKVITGTDDERYYLTMADPIKNENGNVLWVSCLSKDITERKLAEEALMKSEEKYRLLADHMTDTIWLMDLNLQTYYISPSIEKIRNFQLDEIMALPLEKQMPPESLRRAVALYEEEMAILKDNPEHNFIRSIELEFYRKDGSTYWSENTFSLMKLTRYQRLKKLSPCFMKMQRANHYILIRNLIPTSS